ncbi:MAG: hypothetical protein IJM62_01355 [Lachnospiraceae bacterium]|nr:hypothetical protein [Lachnospiraceae bacterium]
MNKQEILEELNKFPFSPVEYWIIAGGAMVMHGVMEETADIDLGCTSKMADRLEEQGFLKRRSPEGRRCFGIGELYEIFEEWLYDGTETVGGYRVITLQGLLEMKRELGREKDMEDIKRIEEFMKRGE